jgi:hypothetical protein
LNENEDLEIGLSKVLRRDGDEEERNGEIPLREEVESVTNKMRSNRPPGEDDVVAELIKYGGPILVGAMYKFIAMFWEKEVMPVCWRTSIICPILKNMIT